MIAADCSQLAPAIYEADKYYIVPGIKDPAYLETILEICRKEKITGVLSLIDPELSILARHEEEFLKCGTRVIGSDYERCELSLDKYKMFCWLKAHGYRTAMTFRKKKQVLDALAEGELAYPVFIKPVKGSASLDITKARDEKDVRFLFQNEKELMVQEYMDGQEIGVDVYVDLLSHKVVSVFAKKKLRMRSGETDKSVSFKEEKLFALVKQFAEEAGFAGQVDMDLFEKDGEYYISEVNPRFGGGYPHAYECGVNTIKMMLNNLAGRTNFPDIGNYEENVYMLKYSDVMIRKAGDN